MGLGKIQGSDVKTLADLGGDGTRLIQVDQIYVTANSINKQLSQAITDRDVNTPNISTIVSPTVGTNTYDMTTTPSPNIINHNLSNSCLYMLPASSSSVVQQFTFHHNGTLSGTDIVITATNKYIYFRRSSTDYTAILTEGTYTRGALATEIYTRMTAQDANINSCAYSPTTQSIVIGGTAPFEMRFGTYTSNSANVAMGFPALDSVSATRQQGMSLANEIRIQPAATEQLRYGHQLIVYPGCLTISTPGINVTIQGVGSTTWNVQKTNAELSGQNATIGSMKDITLVGRDSWVTKFPLNTIRSMMACFSLNEYGYSVGGAVTGTSTSTVEQYNYSSNLWTTKANIGAATQQLAGFLLNNYGYITGGYTTTQTSVVQQYNDINNTWTTKAPIQIAKYYLGDFSFNGYGYAMGGFQVGTSYSTVQQYNDATDTWILRGYMFTFPYTHTTFVLNSYGYVYGSQTYNSTVQQYNDTANTWVYRAPPQVGRTLPTGLSINGYGYCVGGGASGTTRTSNVNQYNDSANAWVVKTSASVIKEGSGGFSLTGYGYCAGGEDGTYISLVEQYN